MNSPAELPETMTQKDFATLLRVSEPMVVKHKRAGRLAMAGRLVLVRESLARIDAWKDPARGGDRGSGKPVEAAHSAAQAAETPSLRLTVIGADADRLNYNIQAAREKLAAAQLRELELAREAGELVLKADRDSAEFGRARAGREAILSIPDRLAVILAAKTDPAEIHALLLAECRRVCNLLASLTDATVPAAEVEAIAA